MEGKENIILEKTFKFSLDIINVYQQLTKEHEYIISKQLLKSGTSVGANVNESTAAQTKADFITKMAIASKEARETKYWLRLLKESKLVHVDLSSLLKEIDEIISILTVIVKTAQKNR
jgi:four helix bundle protein